MLTTIFILYFIFLFFYNLFFFFFDNLLLNSFLALSLYSLLLNINFLIIKDLFLNSIIRYIRLIIEFRVIIDVVIVLIFYTTIINITRLNFEVFNL